MNVLLAPVRAALTSGPSRESAVLLAVQIFYKLTGIAILGAISRQLDPTAIGAYFYALSLCESLTVMGNLSLNQVMMRRVATSANPLVPLGAVLGLRRFGIPLYLLVVAGVAAVLARDIWLIVLAIAIATLFEDLYFTLGAFFMGLRRAYLNVVVGVGVHTAFLVVFFGGMAVAPSLQTVIGANIFRGFGLVTLALLMIRWRVGRLQLDVDRGLVREGTLFIGFTLIRMLRERLDTLILAQFATYALVGHYQLGWRILIAANFVPSTIALVLYPRLTQAGPTPEGRRLLLRGAATLGGLGVLGAVLLIVLATPLTTVLYGPQSADVAPLLRGLAILLPLGFLDAYLSVTLPAFYQERRVFNSLLLSAGVGLALNLTLIPTLGAYGGILAQILSSLLRLGLYTWHMLKLFSNPVTPSYK